MTRNQYAISFGRIPNKYISRSIFIDYPKQYVYDMMYTSKI